MPLVTPTVSICLPVFNGEDFIETAIRSVQDQTHSNFELIVIDDCSTDSSPELIETLSRDDKRIRFFRNHSRLGLFNNYNECMQRASGRYIKPFAQDDVLFPSILTTLIHLIESNQGLALVSTARNFIDAKGHKLPDDGFTPNACNFLEPGKPISRREVLRHSINPIKNFIGEPSTVLFPRNLIGNGFNPDFPHLGDLEFWFRLLLNGDYACTSEILCSFRQHEQSQSSINLENLSVATDYLSMAHLLAPSVQEFELDCESFINSSITELASHINTMVSAEKISLKKAKADYTERLQDLVLRVLCLLGNVPVPKGPPKLEPYRQIYFNERHIKRLENYLRSLLSDPGWKYTRLLRELKCKLFCSQNSSEMLSDTFDHNLVPAQLANWQNSYLCELYKQIAKIKQSNSWKLRNMFGSNPFLHKQEIIHNYKQLLWTMSRLPNLQRIISKKPTVSLCSLDDLIAKKIYEKVLAKTPKVSVLISVHHEWVAKTLLALNSQSLPSDDFEVIIVDANDADNFVNGVAAVVSQPVFNMQLRALCSVKGGRALAHNIALRLARADLVIFIADDFIPNEKFLEAHLDFHRFNKEFGVVGIGTGAFPNELRDTEFRRWLEDTGMLYGIPFTTYPLQIPLNFFYTANSSMKKELIEKAGCFDEDFCHDAWDDYEMGLRLSAVGARSLFVPGADCIHFHPQELQERSHTMQLAGQAACIFDCKYQGVKQWHADFNITAEQYRQSAKMDMVKHLILQKQSIQHRYWKRLLTANFIEGYLNKLQELIKL